MKYEFETRCIHPANLELKQHPYGAVSIPIYQTAIFSHPGIGEAEGITTLVKVIQQELI